MGLKPLDALRRKEEFDRRFEHNGAKLDRNNGHEIWHYTDTRSHLWTFILPNHPGDVNPHIRKSLIRLMLKAGMVVIILTLGYLAYMYLPVPL